MELEDARDRDSNYADMTYSNQAEKEKIDKLPPESRENIKDQMRDIIIQGGGWQPGDQEKEYPYEPSEPAQSDPELARQG